MNTGLVDTHAHLMDAAFDADRQTVIERARAAGVAALLLVGYDLPTSQEAVRLARGLVDWARASVGIHPNSAAAASAADFDGLARLARAPEVVAIGETGLDYFRQHTPPAQQRDSFAWHLRLAEELRLPVLVHNREADADVADALAASAARRTSGTVPGVLHCFSSSDPLYLQRMLDAGYFVSFAGPLTFKSAGTLRAMAARVPIERLLVETDCPYLAPMPHRGQRNEPAFMSETAACLAEVIGVDLVSFTRRLWTNSLQVFPSFGRVRERVRQEVA